MEERDSFTPLRRKSSRYTVTSTTGGPSSRRRASYVVIRRMSDGISSFTRAAVNKIPTKGKTSFKTILIIDRVYTIFMNSNAPMAIYGKRNICAYIFFHQLPWVGIDVVIDGTPYMYIHIPSTTDHNRLDKKHEYAHQDIGKILVRSYQGHHDHAWSWQG